MCVFISLYWFHPTRLALIARRKSVTDFKELVSSIDYPAFAPSIMFTAVSTGWSLEDGNHYANHQKEPEQLSPHHQTMDRPRTRHDTTTSPKQLIASINHPHP
jgi:hypothetical protein